MLSISSQSQGWSEILQLFVGIFWVAAVCLLLYSPPSNQFYKVDFFLSLTSDFYIVPLWAESICAWK